MKHSYLKLSLLIIIFCLIPSPSFAYLETLADCSGDVDTLCNEYHDALSYITADACIFDYSRVCDPLFWYIAQDQAMAAGYTDISAFVQYIIDNYSENDAGGAGDTGDTGDTGSDVADTSGDPNVLDNPLGATSLPGMFGNVLEALLAMLGSAAFLVFIYGGIMMITSGGNEEKIKKSRQILVWAALGVAAILASYSIIGFVFSVFGA